MNTYLQKSFPVLTPLLLSLPFSINANDIDAFGDLDFSLPIVTSASRLSESVLSSPSAVTVLDQALIEASGFTEVADLMRLVPGFIVSHAWGGNLAVINHGEGNELPNRMQILIDGRSTYTNALSAIEWNALGVHIEDIERIEVVLALQRQRMAQTHILVLLTSLLKHLNLMINFMLVTDMEILVRENSYSAIVAN